MPRLIKDGQVVDNPWHRIPQGETLEQALAHEASHLLLPASLWAEHRQAAKAAGKTCAPWLESGELPDKLLEHLAEAPLIALEFPKFADGRSYSVAAMLRQHHGYGGELRAIGEVLRDQLFYMKRCGFDSFELSDCVKLEDALSAFQDFADNYQSTVEQPLPLFKRRAG